MTRDLPDESATGQLGADLAQAAMLLPPTAVLVCHLQGELGAGKTSCARGFLRALGVTGAVKSPTYALIELYELARTIVHCDLYRLKTPEELTQIGLLDYLLPGNVLLIEWPERGGRYVPPADVLVQLEYRGESRRANLSACRATGEQWLSAIGS